MQILKDLIVPSSCSPDDATVGIQNNGQRKRPWVRSFEPTVFGIEQRWESPPLPSFESTNNRRIRLRIDPDQAQIRGTFHVFLKLLERGVTGATPGGPELDDRPFTRRRIQERPIQRRSFQIDAGSLFERMRREAHQEETEAGHTCDHCFQTHTAVRVPSSTLPPDNRWLTRVLPKPYVAYCRSRPQGPRCDKLPH